MKINIVYLSLVLELVGCGSDQSQQADNTPHPRIEVTVTQCTPGHIEQVATFPATTAYQAKSVIASPVAGYIAEVYVQVGTSVHIGQLLYRIETKERRALDESGNAGIVTIRAACPGIVSEVQQLKDNYVPEGAPMCTIVDTKSLVFEVNVPYEQRHQVHSGDNCTLELPDGTRLQATIKAPLATMNIASQSERVIAYAHTGFLPEGLYVKAMIAANVDTDGKGLILPKEAVQSDETLTQFWVMKVEADGTAVKVPVEPVGHDAMHIEIASSELSVADRIVVDGAYGLEDGAKVVIVKN